ncbi:class I SAM-dependent methyltransferase [Methylophilales bacterium]|nr:class I SAM-dependent methyltransferase [Methylophilales bacterium]
MSKNILIKFKEKLVDANGIMIDKNHNDLPFLDNEQEDIWIKIHDNSFWYEYRQNLIYEMLQKYSFTNDIVDIGSGIGTTSIFLSSKGYNTESIEPSYKSCSISKKRGAQKVVNANITNSNIKIKADINVLLLDVLEHIEDDNIFLKNINKKCSNSTFFITVPAYNFLWSSEDEHALHYRRYSLIEIKQKLKDAGFKIQFSSYFFSYLTIPILLFRTIPYRLKFKTQAATNKINHHVPSNFFTTILKFLQKQELKLMSNNKKILFGSSVLIIATNK